MVALDFCPSDQSFGPAVRGCRSDFDFTLRFEQVIFAVVPSCIFLVFSIPRIAYLVRKPLVVTGKLFQGFKLVSLNTKFSSAS